MILVMPIIESHPLRAKIWCSIQFSGRIGSAEFDCPSPSGKSDAQSGAALVELTFVLTALLGLLIGVLSIGGLISQISWLSQLSFQALVLGSIYDDPIEREVLMANRVSAMTNWYSDNSINSRRFGSVAIISAERTPSPSGNRVIEARVSGALPTLIGPDLPLPLEVRVTGPVIAIQASSIPQGFSNPSPLFDGNASRIPGCYDYSCSDDVITCTSVMPSDCTCDGGLVCDY